MRRIYDDVLGPTIFPGDQHLWTDQLEEAAEAGMAANNRLCHQLDAVFGPESRAAYDTSEQVAPALRGLTTRLVHEVPEQDFGVRVIGSWRITDGLTTHLTYGRGSTRSAIVRAGRRRGTYNILFINGWKDDPGVSAEHGFAMLRVTSDDDLRQTLDMPTLDQLVNTLGEPDESSMPVTVVRRGELSWDTWDISRQRGSEATRTSLRNGTTMAGQATEALASIGKWVRTRQLLVWATGLVQRAA